jgi:hypothetical protein
VACGGGPPPAAPAAPVEQDVIDHVGSGHGHHHATEPGTGP